MFAKALSIAENYTLPVIFTKRFMSDEIRSSCGSFVVVNEDGWILTAAHIVKEIILHEQCTIERQAFEQAKKEILDNTRLHPNDKKKRLHNLKTNPSWSSHLAVLWGFANSQIKQFHFDDFTDLAIGRLEPFDPKWVKTYPVFKNPATPMPPGTSLCRLGFPFHQINATFDKATGQFALADGVLPVPRFPNDGIHTRIAVNMTPDGKRQAKFLETSSPGLRGQSGGPIFDRDANIWALQSRTVSLPLGFSPEVVDGNRTVVEHQFMNIGWGTHVEEIIKFFEQFKVSFALSENAPAAI